MRVTLATYNIHGCIGMDRLADPERIAQVIKEMDADVVALQEVESPLGRSEDILRFLSQHAGYRAVAGPTLLRDGSPYGNAVLTRAHILSTDRLDLSMQGREPRGALDLNMALRGVQFRIVATHLGLKPYERRTQIKKILRYLPRPPVHPVALMGDFNEWFAWGRPLRWAHRYFGRTSAARTFPANYPLFGLDRIWVHPPRSVIQREVYRSELARVASDHLPVRAVAEW